MLPCKCNFFELFVIIMPETNPSVPPKENLPTMYDLPSEEPEDSAIRDGIEPPPSPRDTLPTMYDLPSEHPEDPGLPDTFHFFQAELLNNTFFPANYPQEEVFSAADLNLYYDVTHQNWYKRPDWFAAVGVSQLYDHRDLRLSYVVWQERLNPFIVVELLSPTTQKEDLGQTSREPSQPPTKWEVYEQLLRIPYYVVFDRYEDRLRIFGLNCGHYQLLELSEPRLWLEEIGIGIGIWEGRYKEIERRWLRWYDAENNWIPTPEERADSEKQRADSEKQRNERLIAQLRSLGVEPDL